MSHETDESRPAPAPALAPVPEVIPIGCDVLTADAACGLRPGSTLELWVALPPAEAPRVELGGVPLAAEWTAAGEGSKVELRPAPGLLSLELADTGRRWELGIAAAAPLPTALLELEARVGVADIEAVRDDLLALIPRLQGAALAEALALRGDLEFRRGDDAAALAAYEVAFTVAVAEGLLGRASDIAVTAVFSSVAVLHDLPAARRWLKRHEELLGRFPEARLDHDYYVGLVADRAGDASAALRNYRDCAARARALGRTRDLAVVSSALGVLQGRLGDAVAAEAAFADALALADALSELEHVTILYNAGWVALEARARGEPAPDPEPRFDALAALVAPDGPHADPYQAADAQLNLAYAAVLRGDVAAARAALARAEFPGRRVARWRLYLAARIDLLAGQPLDALRRFDALAARAREDDDRGLEWSAEFGAGEALSARDDLVGALERFRRADALHRADVGRLALDAGRERFAAERDHAARRLVETLLALDRADEALCAARRARAHAFADLAALTRDPAALAAYRDARAAHDAAFERTWELPRREGAAERARLRSERRTLDARLDAALRGPADLPDSFVSKGHVASSMSEKTSCESLRAPGPGELLLVYYPLGAGRVGFARDAGGLAVARIDGDLASDPAARATQLLGPFDAAIARAERVTFVAAGALAAEPFHALPWRGAPLVAARSVAYGLDLPRAPDRRRALARAVQLVPPSNLARADDEAGAAAEALRAHDVALARLRGDEPDLARRLAELDLLHFIGHARGDGWGGALDLGGERRLSTGDLLAMPAPAIAVLSGCETGLLDPRAHGGGMSLAHALLVAGADVVVAADARIADDLAAELVPALIAAIAEGADPVDALRLAQEHARATRDDWSHFRAYVR